VDTVKINHQNTKMIAHRGLSGLEKENTMAAFIAAGNRSYYGIECDIHKTIDNVFVVIHDDDTSRVSQANKIIANSTYLELKNIELDDINNGLPKSHLRIPTLVEYVDSCIKYNKACVIEFKNQFSEKDIYSVMNIITERKYLHKVIFISFIIENLITIRNRDKFIRLQFLTSKYNEQVLEACCKYKFDIDINYKALNKQIVDELHQYNIQINVWTVDNPTEALMLIGLGVEYITTNILE
jgi:glycerophosphoryl diester phosphodiesterase